MSADYSGDVRVSYNKPEITHPLGLPDTYKRAILRCAANSKTRKEFMDNVYGIGVLDDCTIQDGSNFWNEISEMAGDICKYLPEVC